MPASRVATVGLFGGVQLLCLGLLGEYVARLFVASQQRPTYLVGYDSLTQHATQQHERAASAPSVDSDSLRLSS